MIQKDSTQLQSREKQTKTLFAKTPNYTKDITENLNTDLQSKSRSLLSWGSTHAHVLLTRSNGRTLDSSQLRTLSTPNADYHKMEEI